MKDIVMDFEGVTNNDSLHYEKEIQKIVEAMMIDTTEETRTSEMYATSDIANVRQSDSMKQLDHVFLTSRNPMNKGVEKGDATKKVLTSLKIALDCPIKDIETDLPDEIVEDLDNLNIHDIKLNNNDNTNNNSNENVHNYILPEKQPIKIDNKLIIEREKDPLNEFECNDEIMHGAFVLLFFLGKGWIGTGSASNSLIDHFLHYHDHRFVNDPKFIFTLFDQKRRHQIASEIKAKIMNNKNIIETTNISIFDKDFMPKLVKAIDNPDSEEANIIFKLISPIIKIGTADIPFSLGHRSAVFGKLYSLNFFFGLPSIYYTQANDDVYTPLAIRNSLVQRRIFDNNIPIDYTGKSILSILQGDNQQNVKNLNLHELASKHPYAQSEAYHDIIEAEFRDLLGHALDEGGNKQILKTKLMSQYKKGIFGTVRAAAGCVETNSRSALHGHHVIWTVLMPRLIQQIASYPELREAAIAVIDSISCSDLPIHDHLRAYRSNHRRDYPEEPILKRGALNNMPFPVCNSNYQYDSNWEKYSTSNASMSQIHKHACTCHKIPQGKYHCRMCFPKECNEKGTTFMYLKHVVDNGDMEANKIGYLQEDTEPIPHWTRMPIHEIGKNYKDPLPSKDDRYIIIETNRPTITHFDELLLLRTQFLEVIVHTDNIIIPILDIELINDIISVGENISDEEFNSKKLRYKGSIIYKGDIKLRRNENDMIVPHSKPINAIFGCNNALYVLGNDENARIVVFYVCKYIAKDGVKVASALTSLKIALTLQAKFQREIVEVKIKDKSNKTNSNEASNTIKINEIPAVQYSEKDKRVPEHYDRNKRFMNMFLNRMEGSPMEIEATQAASILYGSTGFTCTHKFWNLFLSAAMLHVRETCTMKYPQVLEDKKDEMISDNELKNSNIIHIYNETNNENNDNNNNLADDKHINILRNHMEKMDINDQGGVLEYKMNSQNEILYAEESIAENEVSIDNLSNIFSNHEEQIIDYDIKDHEEVSMDPNYTYVDIDELASIDITEHHLQVDDENDRGLREIVYDIDKNPMMLMQHNYYM